MQSHLKDSGYKILPISPDNAGSYNSSIPLILPNDLEYDFKTKSVIKKADVDRTSLYLVPEALELLNSVTSPLAVMAICGPMQSGKSYILSRLLGEPDAFKLGQTMDPKKMGMWMGTKIFQGKDKNGNEQAVLLLDTEGIDAPRASLSQDAGILVLTILISSVLIYNSLSVPKKSDLEKLDCFIRLAQGFEVKRGKEIQGGEVSQYFPHFTWLLRDVSLAIVDDEGNEVDPTDYIKEKVLSRGIGYMPSKAEEVGRAIITFFPDIECKTLPIPHNNKEIMQNIARHTNDLNPKFQREVQDLMTHLITKVQTNGPKRGYQVGSAVTGPLLCGLLKEYVEAVNDPGAIPGLDNAWQNTVDLLKAKTMDELVKEYKAFMKKKIRDASVRRDGKTYPLEEHEAKNFGDATLMGLHGETLQILTEKLLKKMAHFGVGDVKGLKKNSEELVNSFQERIIKVRKKKGFTVNEDGNKEDYEGMEVCGGELLEFIRKNRQLSAEYCTKLYQQLFAPIQFKIENEVETYTCTQLAEDFKKMNEEYIERAIGPEKWNVLSEMDKKTVEAQKNNLKKMKGYQEKVMKEKLKAKDAQIEAGRKNEELKKLYQEAAREREKNADNLEKMKENYKTQLQKLKDEHAKRMKEEVKKIDDLHQSKFDEFQDMFKESSRIQNQVMEEMIKNMEIERKQYKEQMEIERKQMEKLIAAKSTIVVKDDSCSIL